MQTGSQEVFSKGSCGTVSFASISTQALVVTVLLLLLHRSFLAFATGKGLHLLAVCCMCSSVPAEHLKKLSEVSIEVDLSQQNTDTMRTKRTGLDVQLVRWHEPHKVLCHFTLTLTQFGCCK